MPLANGIRPEQGSLPRPSPGAAPARNKPCLSLCLLAVEQERQGARKDPLGLPAVLKNPTGFRVEGAWVQADTGGAPIHPTPSATPPPGRETTGKKR